MEAILDYLLFYKGIVEMERIQGRKKIKPNEEQTL